MEKVNQKLHYYFYNKISSIDFSRCKTNSSNIIIYKKNNYLNINKILIINLS